MINIITITPNSKRIKLSHLVTRWELAIWELWSSQLQGFGTFFKSSESCFLFKSKLLSAIFFFSFFLLSSFLFQMPLFTLVSLLTRVVDILSSNFCLLLSRLRLLNNDFFGSGEIIPDLFRSGEDWLLSFGSRIDIADLLRFPNIFCEDFFITRFFQPPPDWDVPVRRKVG